MAICHGRSEYMLVGNSLPGGWGSPVYAVSQEHCLQPQLSAGAFGSVAFRSALIPGLFQSPLVFQKKNTLQVHLFIQEKYLCFQRQKQISKQL